MLMLKVLLLPLTSALFVVPRPSGPYNVSLTDLQFVDTNRTDPYTGASERKIPISLITPLDPSAKCQPVQQMYMPNATANFWEQEFGTLYDLPLKNTVSRVVLSLCKPTTAQHEHPLILFSPGLGLPRQFYNILGSNIAAQGFTVATVDVPGEPGFITFLDGSTERGDANITTPAQHTAAIEVRVKDLEFILHSLHSYTGEPGHQYWRLNASSAASFGHSFGGDAALSSLIAEDRLIGGADMDGSFYGAPLTHKTEKPFLIFASDMAGPLQHNQTTVQGWAVVWQNLLGPKWQLQIKDSAHNTFTDIIILGDLFGLYKIPGVTEILGSINPWEALNIQVSVLSTLAKILFGHKNVTSVIEIAKNFKEVVVVNATHVG